jgi:hypothetical protein
MMKKYDWKVSLRPQGLLWAPVLYVCCFAGSIAIPARGQAPMPPTPPVRQEANTPLPDPFYNALEGLSKKYDIAIIAEGRPFPQTKHGPLSNSGAMPDNGAMPENGEDPAQEEDMPQADKDADAPPPTREAAQDAEVQRVANKYDYDAVRQGKVYLLQKRYTNPDDLPEVSPEELREWVKHLDVLGGGRTVEKALVSSVNETLLNIARSRHPVTQDEFVYRVLHNGVILRDFVNSPSIPDMHMYWLTRSFFFLSHEDRNRATRDLLANSLPRDPIFHWQPLGQTPVFGYDTQFTRQSNLLFIPASDCDRIVVVPYGTPLPRSDYWMRMETQLPDPDPSDPAGLSDQTKRFLDDNGRSSRAITLAEAINPINKTIPKTPGYKIYQVDPIYASKRVTMVGTEKLSPETLMQSLAAVFGLGVDHRRDDHVVLNRVPETRPDNFDFTVFREYDKYVRQRIPAPIYRVIHASFLAGRSKAKNQEGQELLAFETQYEFQKIGATLRNAAMRQFRYLAEPQVKAAPKEKLSLSHLGEREQKLFMFAQTIPAYAGACELAEIPLPPYLTHSNYYMANAKITGGVYQKGGSPTGPYVYDPHYFSKMIFNARGYSCPDDTARLALYVTYVDPNSGVAYGPVQFLDVSLYLSDLQGAQSMRPQPLLPGCLRPRGVPRTDCYCRFRQHQMLSRCHGAGS